MRRKPPQRVQRSSKAGPAGAAARPKRVAEQLEQLKQRRPGANPKPGPNRKADAKRVRTEPTTAASAGAGKKRQDASSPLGKKKRPLRDRTKKERRTIERKVGRPSKYSAQIAQKIFAAVESGMSRTAAGALYGFHPQTISDWLVAIPEFADGIEQARARGISRRLEEVSAGVNLAGLKDWRASAWLLERLDREHFGKGPGVSVQVSASAEAGASAGFVLSEAELGEIQARRAAALRGQEPPASPAAAEAKSGK